LIVLAKHCFSSELLFQIYFILTKIIDSTQIELPSGYIDEDESPKQAAIRELKEETGYTAKDVISIGHYTLDYSMFEQKGNLFVAYGLAEEQRVYHVDMQQQVRYNGRCYTLT
jgi:8-oxo-dGTP pyrophosphatase MutT (NUDIX family)